MGLDKEYIDCTPTWRGILPALLLIWTRAETAATQQEAMDELMRMATLADQYVVARKVGLVKDQERA